MDPWYPSIDTKVLVPVQVIKENLDRDPSYLNRPECPYSSEVKSILRKLFEVKSVGVSSSTFFKEGENQDEAIMREIDRIYTDALNLDAQLASTEDASEKIQLLKARSQILQKLVDLRAQMMNIRSMTEFQNTVIQFMEEVLNPDQITDFMQRIRKAI